MSARTVLLAGAAALLPTIAVLAAPVPVAAQGPVRFAPPATPLVLTRTVWRSLRDGRQVVARRRYAVHFAPDGGGFRLDGELIDSSVEAPPALQAIARLEEGRSDAGLFPIMLDAGGRIVGHSAPLSAARHAPDGAGAGRLLDRTVLPSAERRQADGFVQRLLAEGGTSAWPEDLFSAAAGEQVERRRIALADGSEGAVTIATRANLGGPEGLPEMVERTVTTELGGTTRTTREQWTLTLRTTAG